MGSLPYSKKTEDIIIIRFSNILSQRHRNGDKDQKVKSKHLRL